ncbi:unnamed protein product [Vitrella brassicaformis CCMP3155]|uniref:Protein kinase domain-containing protein n=1 Tax=Vitrella brassicaformis (strain CCMP3155) TaxID=1169540 RepID=A0A0G4EDR8_VITBC|nr:unnamed protein product [Vitrella brassicaformis CCMP3155]|eukprot:CEL93871.1 unnamed protein product [Vitrella brassicaformis CCMP3155]
MHTRVHPPLPLEPPADFVRQLEEKTLRVCLDDGDTMEEAQGVVEAMKQNELAKREWDIKVWKRDVEGVLHDLYGLRVLGKLGEGGQADLWRLEGGKVAKVLDTEHSIGGFHHKPTYRRYIEKGLALCPNIVRLVGDFAVTRSSRSCIIMEHVEGRGVWELCGSLGEGDVRAVASDLLHALSFLHRRRLAHLDVKPENLIKRRDGSTVLIDLDYMDEDKKGEGARRDMFDTVVTLLRMAGVDHAKASQIAASTPTEEAIRRALLPFAPSTDLVDFIEGLLKGMSAEEALRHPWLTTSPPQAPAAAAAGPTYVPPVYRLPPPPPQRVPIVWPFAPAMMPPLLLPRGHRPFLLPPPPILAR